MQKYVIALYIRLSIEDYKYDSLSIENQSLVLHEYAASMPEALNAEIMEFIDNGYSGTNFERPQVQKLIELVRANQIDCIIVKDFSRFGRNSIETGYFIERVFPLFHTRFISISDDFDSSKFKGDTGGMDVAFKYLISEYYSRDMSIKTKSAKYAKMQRGEYQSKICPYGYRKSAALYWPGVGMFLRNSSRVMAVALTPSAASWKISCTMAAASGSGSILPSALLR